MYKVNGFLPLTSRRGRRQMLDLRAPEDRLLSDDGVSNVRRSSAVSNWIDAYRTADREDDEQGRVDALTKVIDANRADMAASGVPVFAHSPLPDDFATELAHDWSESPLQLLGKFEPGVRLLVTRQLKDGSSSGAHPYLLDGEDPGSGRRSRESMPGRPGGQAGRASPDPRQKPPGPVSPRPHPDHEKREADCAAIRGKHASQRRAVADYQGRKKAWESELKSLKNRREAEVADLDANALDLSEARSRSTEPPFQVWMCPDDGPQKPSRRRETGRQRRERRERMIQEGICRSSGPIISEDQKRRWRRTLEMDKEREINRLEAERNAIEQRISDLDDQIELAKGRLDDVAKGLDSLLLGLDPIENDYRQKCGDPRDLWRD